MNRRGFLAILVGAPIAAKMAPELPYTYTQIKHVPFGLSEPALFTPSASPLIAMMDKLKQKVEGPSGDASFISTVPQTNRFEWLETEELNRGTFD